MIAARRREREYFANSPEYRHLANRMGSEHLGKVLSKVCENTEHEFHSSLSLKEIGCLFFFFFPFYQQ